MLTILLTLFITTLATFIFGYVVHWMLHRTWAGRFNKSHMAHHLELYPSTDYYSDKYRSAGKDATIWFFAVASLPMLAIPVLLFLIGVLPLSCMILAILVMLKIGFLHNFIHDAFHISNHWMNKVPYLKYLFLEWNRLHYIHHVDMEKNYGIFTFHWDKLFGTFSKT